MTTTHNDRVREQFAGQAATFANTGFAVRGLQWILDTLQPQASESALDVACGAAHLARALAPHVAHVSGVDLTPEMLQQADRLAREQHIGNLTLQVGDATRLPFLDEQFDLVVCRLALHQVDDPAAFVREMARVVRRDGRLAVVDMVAPPDAEQAAETNRLERLRDPSHGRTLAVEQIHGLLADAGCTVARTVTEDQPLDVEDWMQRTATPAADREVIRRRFEDELAAAAAPTGLQPFRDAGGALGLVHTWAIVTAGR